VHLNLTQNLKLSQELRLTPMMIQSMEILQLQVMQLQARIHQELEENPVLEIPEQELPETSASDNENDTLSDTELHIDEGADSFKELEALEKTLEPFDSKGKGVRPNQEASDAKHEAIQNTAAPGITLQGHLEEQIRMFKLSPREYQLALFIVYNIDDDGYLKVPLTDLLLTMEEEMAPLPKEEELREIIDFLRFNCDPVGVCSRNLAECLLTQAQQIKDKPKWTEKIIENHLDDLLNNRLPHLAKELELSLEEIKEVRDFLHLLNPRPGNLFGQGQSSRVIPDVIITEDEDHSFIIRLENSFIPEIRISQNYRKMMEEKKEDAQTLGYVKGKLDSARWLIDAIQQRQMTIYKIATEIVKIQEDFLRKGIEHLKCLKMQDIADAVGVHVSTVSRAISGKYVQCPQGIFPMKNFFTGGSANEDGSLDSHQAVRNRVREMIDREDSKKPMSDDEIVNQLKKQGITLARRTVAKYRKLMNIPSARLRRQY
jgi:RNA polymerase sigma-54 factor